MEVGRLYLSISNPFNLKRPWIKFNHYKPTVFPDGSKSRHRFNLMFFYFEITVIWR